MVTDKIMQIALITLDSIKMIYPMD